MQKVVDIKAVLDQLENVYKQNGWDPDDDHFSLRYLKVTLAFEEFDFDAKIEECETKYRTLERRFETLNDSLDFAEKRVYGLEAKCKNLEAEKDDAVEALLLAMSEFAKYKKSR